MQGKVVMHDERASRIRAFRITCGASKKSLLAHSVDIQIATDDLSTGREVLDPAHQAAALDHLYPGRPLRLLVDRRRAGHGVEDDRGDIEG